MGVRITNNTIVMITMLMTILMVLIVDAKPNCKPAGKPVKQAYNDEVRKLVQKLQNAAANNDDFKAALKVGSVKGKASCTPTEKDRTKAIADCRTCLGAAKVDLSVNCKGSLSGSSDGITSIGLDGACQMSFGPAK
ncbi:hypothetical protein LINPERPRIM_LOCUS35861 [Linum perenne]